MANPGDGIIVARGRDHAEDAKLMKPAELAQARGQLVAFAAEMLASLPRPDQRRWGET